MSEKITYSIVIPVYNNQDGIEILVDSVVNYFQDQSKLEPQDLKNTLEALLLVELYLMN